MERLSHTDFLLRNQPRLFIRALRAVLREDPAVVECTAIKIEDGAYRLRIVAADPVMCLHNATQNIKSALLSATLVEKTRSALPSA